MSGVCATGIHGRAVESGEACRARVRAPYDVIVLEYGFRLDGLATLARLQARRVDAQGYDLRHGISSRQWAQMGAFRLRRENAVA